MPYHLALLFCIIQRLERTPTFCLILMLCFYLSYIVNSTKMARLHHMQMANGILTLLVLLLIWFTINRDYLLHPQNINVEPHGQGNLSSTTDPPIKGAPRQDDSEQFHIVTNFVPFTNKDLRKGLQIDGKPPTDQQLEDRMAEILGCLQRNLNNSMIAYVHILVFSEETITYLQSLELKNNHKLIIHKNYKWPTISDQLLYASTYLQGKIVVMCHQDNFIGKGWDKVNHTLLMRERLMYALTRHPAPSKCPVSTSSFHCGEGDKYVGSHDVFVFYMRESLDRQQFVELDVTPNLNLMENALMWTFKERLHYRILNPCKVLMVHHMHCITIREAKRKNVNAYYKGMYLKVPFTDQLQ